MAGCTIPEIAAITGHTYMRCEQILETYLPLTTDVGRNAISNVMKLTSK